MIARSHDDRSLQVLYRRHWVRRRDQFRELPEVLGCGGEQKFVLSAARPSQPEPVEPQDALEMCEQHLNFLSKAT
jgi:hypothetical protein